MEGPDCGAMGLMPRAVAMQDSQRLGSLVRLADYMLVEGSLQLLEQTLIGLRDACQEKAVFSLDVTFAEEGLVFTPQEEQVTQVGSCWQPMVHSARRGTGCSLADSGGSGQFCSLAQRGDRSTCLLEHRWGSCMTCSSLHSVQVHGVVSGRTSSPGPHHTSAAAAAAAAVNGTLMQAPLSSNAQTQLTLYVFLHQQQHLLPWQHC
jgi:hypothetical protein